MDVSGGVLEGFLVLDAEAVTDHGASDLSYEFLSGVGGVPEAGDAALAPPIAALLVHRRMSKLMEGRRVVFLDKGILRKHRDNDLVPGGRVERSGRLLVIVESKTNLTGQVGIDGLLGLLYR